MAQHLSLKTLREEQTKLDEELNKIDQYIKTLSKHLEVPPVKPQEGYGHVVLVDNLPIIPKDKLSKLEAVLQKIVDQLSSKSTLPNGIHILFDEASGKSRGFAFIEFIDDDVALSVSQQLDGYRLDKAHVLKATLYNKIDEITSLSEEYQEPDPQDYEPKDILRSWLLNTQPNDQYSLLYGETAEIHWNDPTRPPEHIYRRNRWTDAFIRWSPLGTYLITIHEQGVQIWGGESWSSIKRFHHSGVKLIQFSPCENFLVTFSPKYKDNDNPKDPQCIIVWDVRTGKKCRGFESVSTIQWPEFTWSHDDKYFARLGKDIISVYETETMGLLDKKSIKIPGVQDYCWSPTDNIISCWLPESGNNPARVMLLSIPSKKEIVSKSLFNVSDFRMHWQENGDYLCVKVDKVKAKKTTHTTFEIFRMRSKNIPVEVLEIKDTIIAFAWEPVGHRFAVIHSNTPGNLRPDVSFYEVKPDGVKLLKTLEKRTASHLFWAPTGGFIVLAGLRSAEGHLEFFNVNELEIMGAEDHFGCSHVAWDPTGRYVTSFVSAWSQQQMENGYNIWSFQGKLIHKVLKDRFYQFLWRPRPPTMLTKEKEEYIRQHLKEYSARFAKEELEEKNKVLLELKEKRDRLISQFEKIRQEQLEEYEASRERRRQLWGGEASDEDSGWETYTETVEEIISETSELY